jgi:hypothetical protein
MKGGFRILVLMAVAAAVAVTARAQGPAPAPDAFQERTATATSTVSSIDARVNDIESLRAEAAKKGEAIRLSCIEEKLKRAKGNQAAAKSVMEGWQLGAANPAFSQRSLDRLLLLQVYAMVYVEEARGCTDVNALSQGLEVKVDPNVASQNGSGTAPGGPSAAADPGGINWNRPPRLERPPLASPF